MAQVTLPSPWPGYTDSTASVIKTQMAQGVPAGDGSAALNEITQVQKGLVWFNPSIAPLLRITSKVKAAKVVENARFYHQEKQRLPRTAVLTGVQGATTPTYIDVADTSQFRVNDLVYNGDTGDIFRVDTVTSSTRLTGTANIGDASPSGTLWAIGNTIVNIGNSYVDGGSAGTPFHVVEDSKLYTTQIFKDAHEMSDRYQKTALYEGDPWSNERKQCEQEHLLSIEYACFFGKQSFSVDATGKLTTTMAGLNSMITTNRVDFTDADDPSKATFDDIMVGAMQEGHSGYENKELAVKTAFLSQAWLAVLNSFGDNAIRVHEPSEKTYGLRIMQYQGSWGLLNVVNAPVLNRPVFSHLGFILDLEHVRQANFKGRDTRYEDNIQLPDADGKKAQYLSDKGLIMEIEPAHVVLENLGKVTP